MSNNENSQLADIIGWDIGGANLKAARQQVDGWQVAQQPFAMWQRRAELAAAVAGMSARLGPATRAAVTITAELSDAFRTKREGINFVIEALQAALPAAELRIFGLDGHFHNVATAKANPLLVAAANWLATALVVARRQPNCLLVDVGSTTTDIIPIKGGQVVAQGCTDPERLIWGELVYTGVLRTPLFGIVSQAPLWGRWCGVAAELFTTAQDVHLLLGNLPAEQCTSPSADGRPVTAEFAAERLARLVCADREMLSEDDIQTMAQFIANSQAQQLTTALSQVISASGVTGPLVAVGVGAFLAELAAARLGLACLRPADFLNDQAAAVAPAAAVALLCRDEVGRV